MTGGCCIKLAGAGVQKSSDRTSDTRSDPDSPMRLEKKKNIAPNTSFVPDLGQCGRSAGVRISASEEELQLSDRSFVGANSFQPATLAVMAAAFDATWHKLRSTGDILGPRFAPVRPVSSRRRNSASVTFHGLAMQRLLTPGTWCSIRAASKVPSRSQCQRSSASFDTRCRYVGPTPGPACCFKGDRWYKAGIKLIRT